MLTFRDLIRHPQTGGQMDFRHHVEMVTGKTPPPYSELSGEGIEAYVSHGRWVAECPEGDGGALLVDVLEPYFICPACGNQSHEGKWHTVVLPVDFPAIEAALAYRPDQATRNWRPGESIEDLHAENAEHGIPGKAKRRVPK